MFDWGGEQMALYLGKDLGDLVIITLNKQVQFQPSSSCLLTICGAYSAVEAALAIALLRKCE